MHNSASAPTLYYGTSHRPLQIQPHSELVERFSLHPILSVPQSDADDTASTGSPAPNLASSAPAPPEFESQDTRASFSRQEARPAGHSATSAESQHQLSGSMQDQNGAPQCLSPEVDCADGMTYCGLWCGLALCPVHRSLLSSTPLLLNRHMSSTTCMACASDFCLTGVMMGLLCTGSPRVRLTPNGVVHMGLLSTSRGGRARRRRSDPQQRRAAPGDSTMDSLAGLGGPASGSDAEVREPLQPGHAAGSPGAPAGRPPRSPAFASSAFSEGASSATASRRSLEVGEAASPRSAEELQEDRELLALRPTRDFVQGFNQHTSFHQRRMLRNALEGAAPLPCILLAAWQARKHQYSA